MEELLEVKGHLAHADQRVRMKAQFELVRRGNQLALTSAAEDTERYAATFDVHWERLRDEYPYFDLYGVDWDQERAEHGLSDGLIRMSVGLENVEAPQ